MSLAFLPSALTSFRVIMSLSLHESIDAPEAGIGAGAPMHSIHGASRFNLRMEVPHLSRQENIKKSRTLLMNRYLFSTSITIKNSRGRR